MGNCQTNCGAVKKQEQEIVNQQPRTSKNSLRSSKGNTSNKKLVQGQGAYQQMEQNFDPIQQDVYQQPTLKTLDVKKSLFNQQHGDKPQQKSKSVKFIDIKQDEETEELTQEDKQGAVGILKDTLNPYGRINLINRGRMQSDNLMIESTMKFDQVVRLEQVKLDNGTTYQGQWLKGQRHGFGIQKWHDGHVYQGQWKNNQAHGHGLLTHADGDQYEGDWLNDRANGKGTYLHSNGARYEGQWKNDRQHGFGRQTWPDGQSYQGQFERGAKSGKGILKFKDGSYYKGDFLNNQIHGQGKYVWFESREYQGGWEHNKMQGQGKLLYIDGKVYEGHFQNDKKSGYGTFQWPNGQKYAGQWKDGKQNGKGQFFFANGQRKLGKWQNGKRIKWVQASAFGSTDESFL